MKSVYTRTTETTIKNVVGSSKTSDECENCGPWIDHWTNMSRKTPGKCAVKDCDNEGVVGAHITRPHAADSVEYRTHHYIVPMCREHNGVHGGSFMSKETVTFVWANVQETCGKSS